MAKPKDCPHFKEPCREHGCMFYMQFHGRNPQTGEPFPNDGWGCAQVWQPVLVVEVAKEMRHYAAAVESARNEARVDTMAVTAGLAAIADEGGIANRIHAAAAKGGAFARLAGMFDGIKLRLTKAGRS